MPSEKGPEQGAPFLYQQIGQQYDAAIAISWKDGGVFYHKVPDRGLQSRELPGFLKVAHIFAQYASIKGSPGHQEMKLRKQPFVFFVK